MGKLLLILGLLFSSLQAEELIKVETFAKAQELAKKDNKRILLFLTSPTCYYCKQMKKRTLSISKVIKRINKDYIFVEQDEYRGKYPDAIEVAGVPAMAFLHNSGELIMRPVQGFWSSTDFLSFMDDAERKYNKQIKGK